MSSRNSTKLSTAQKTQLTGRERDGEWMLRKADAITGFVAEQRSRTHKAASKSAWGVAFKQLAAQSDVLGKQVLQVVQQAATRMPDLAPEMDELLQLHQEAAATGQMERLQLMAQVQDLSGLVHSMRCYGLSAVEHLDATLASLQQEMTWLAQDLSSHTATLAAEAEQLSQEIAADSKAALAAVDNRSSAEAELHQLPGSSGFKNLCSGKANSSSSSSAAGSNRSSGADDCSDACADDATQTGHTFLTDLDAPTGEPASADAALRAQHAASNAAELHHDVELQQLISKHLLVPEQLKQQVLEAYACLCQQHQLQVQQLAAAAPQQELQQAGKYGGWSADEHALFVRLRVLAYKSGAGGGKAGKGCSRSAVLERLLLMMPGKNKQQLEQHDRWYTAANLHQRRIADLTAAWQRQMNSFLADSAKMLQEAAAATAAGAEAAAARLTWLVTGQVLHSQLGELQQERERQQKELTAQREVETAAAAAEAAAEQAAWQQQHVAKKEQVAQYKQQLQEQLEAAREQAEQQQAEAKAAAEAAIAAQQPAVAARQEQRWERMQQQLEEQKQRQQATAARQARLAAIAETFAPYVPHDPNRLLQPTASAAAAAEAGLTAAQAAAAAAFKPVHGYTTAQVVADPRFRVAEALRAAGLMTGAAKGYAQQVVAGVQAAETRKDNLTTWQLQAGRTS